ncbi:MAG: hypothetical protein LUI08_02485 [Prevotella sp.]|nr:hypothetical protein [Prevotella sp.]
MEKKKYISPKTEFILLGSEVMRMSDGQSDLFIYDKGTSTWEEPESDDDGFGW